MYLYVGFSVCTRLHNYNLALNINYGRGLEPRSFPRRHLIIPHKLFWSGNLKVNLNWSKSVHVLPRN
jgi:hypothetical protein